MRFSVYFSHRQTIAIPKDFYSPTIEILRIRKLFKDSKDT